MTIDPLIQRFGASGGDTVEFHFNDRTGMEHAIVRRTDPRWKAGAKTTAYSSGHRVPRHMVQERAPRYIRGILVRPGKTVSVINRTALRELRYAAVAECTGILAGLTGPPRSDVDHYVLARDPKEPIKQTARDAIKPTPTLSPWLQETYWPTREQRHGNPPSPRRELAVILDELIDVLDA